MGILAPFKYPIADSWKSMKRSCRGRTWNWLNGPTFICFNHSSWSRSIVIPSLVGFPWSLKYRMCTLRGPLSSCTTLMRQCLSNDCLYKTFQLCKNKHVLGKSKGVKKSLTYHYRILKGYAKFLESRVQSRDLCRHYSRDHTKNKSLTNKKHGNYAHKVLKQYLLNHLHSSCIHPFLLKFTSTLTFLPTYTFLLIL